jgi:hypothetical protein
VPTNLDLLRESRWMGIPPSIKEINGAAGLEKLGRSSTNQHTALIDNQAKKR